MHGRQDEAPLEFSLLAGTHSGRAPKDGEEEELGTVAGGLLESVKRKKASC